MTELESILARLSLSQYLGRLVEEGFEKWETVLDITENDLAFLNFKLGHRRILQREIASARGISPGQPLANSCLHTADDSLEYEDKSSPKPYNNNNRGDSNKPTPTGKRKYKRHPKPDEHAPEKPPSAYVMFANHIRDELKGQSLSFTDIAKLVGEKWKMLDTHHKEGYELDATRAKTKYNMDLAEYRKTDEYKEYLQYLAEFRSKTANEGNEPSDNRKRPKLETHPAAGSSSSAGTTATISSSGSLGMGGGVGGGGANSYSSHRPATSTSSGRLGSISSVTTNNSNFPSPTSQSPLMNSTPLPTQMPPPPSPDSSSPTPGVIRYREHSKTSQDYHMEHSSSHSNNSSHDMEPINLPRIHSNTVQNPHIQQHLSYSRHQSQPTPPPMSAPSSSPSGSTYSRSGTTMPVPVQPARRIEDVRMTNGPGGASAQPMDEGGSRGSHHRALPLPTPSCQHTSGYFDQRSHHQLSPSRSPRSLSYPPLPGPTQLVHSSSYSNPSAVNTPQDQGNGSSVSPSDTTPQTDSLPPIQLPPPTSSSVAASPSQPPATPHRQGS